MYKTERPVELELRSGDSLMLSAHSHFKLFNSTEIELKSGEVNVISHSNKTITISANAFDIKMHSGTSLVISKQESFLKHGAPNTFGTSMMLATE
jgi:hypothetical protein